MKILTFSILTIASSCLTVHGATDFYRLSLRGDPASTMVIGWCQKTGTDPKVYYGTTDQGTNYASYSSNVSPHRQVTVKTMDTRFVRLTGLKPDTNYYFVINDSEGTSPRFWFRTAPSTQQPFTFIAGGDSRTNRTPRRQANQLVAKLRPLFVAFGGDYTDGDSSTQWNEWLTDWQLTTSSDGRMYPVIATRGNHDENATVEGMFDTPSTDVYYALSFGGSLLRLYTLNTEITAGGAQKTWLEGDLAAHSTVWKAAQYHRPMFPHTTYKGDNVMLYDAWAALFYNYRMSLVVECDSHVVKRTWPLRPSTEPGSQLGYIRDDSSGTVFIGEGCWGAPLRNNDDNKTWTRAGGKFNQFDWIHVYPDRMEIRTTPYDNVAIVGTVSNSDPFTPPANLRIWAPPNGSMVTVTRGAVEVASLRDGVSGYAGTRDVHLDSSAPSTNHGTNAALGVSGEPDQTALIKWDVTSIPTGREVMAAFVDLYAEDASLDFYEVYGLKRNWSELAATWNQFAANLPWQLAGANGTDDRGTLPLGSIQLSTVGPRSVSLNRDGLSLVQSWVNTPAGNYGLAFLNNGALDGIVMSSRENAVIDRRPKLTLTYRKETVVSFQDGVNAYSGTTDTKIKADATSSNFGTSTYLELDGLPDYAALIKWNLSSIPPGKTVKSVQINLYIGDTSYDIYEVYSMKRNWTETGATWSQFAAGSPWEVPGAGGANDRGATVLGTFVGAVSPVAAIGERIIQLNAAGIAQVQSWIDSPSTNYGFIICDYSEATDGINIASSEGGATIYQRPKITITYE